MTCQWRRLHSLSLTASDEKPPHRVITDTPKREIRVSLAKDMLVKGAIEPVKDLFGRVLQPSLPSTEELRRVLAGDRPILLSYFSDGDNRTHSLRMLLSRVGEHTGAPTTSRVNGLPRIEKTT